MWKKIASKTQKWNKILDRSKMRSYLETGTGNFESRLFHASENFIKQLNLLNRGVFLEDEVKELISKGLYEIFAGSRYDLDEKYGKHLDTRYEFNRPDDESKNYFRSGKAWLTNYLQNKWSMNDGFAWTQWSLLNKSKSENQENNKIYFTLKNPSDKQNYKKFIEGLAKIANQLSNLQTDLFISFKIPSVLTTFMTHPDTLVIHFKDDGLINEIQNIVNSNLGDLAADRSSFFRVDVGKDIGTHSDTSYKCEKIANFILQQKNYFLQLNPEEFAEFIFKKWLEFND